MKSFKEHYQEIKDEAGKEPDPKSVKKFQRVCATIGIIVFVVGLIGLILASC